MKANEAPEKIYLIRNFPTPTALNTTNDNYGKFLNEWYLSREKDADIEYTRTDAFIEKACEWIKMMWSETDNRFKEDYTEMLVDNFKNYMKGE